MWIRERMRWNRYDTERDIRYIGPFSFRLRQSDGETRPSTYPLYLLTGSQKNEIFLVRLQFVPNLNSIYVADAFQLCNIALKCQKQWKSSYFIVYVFIDKNFMVKIWLFKESKNRNQQLNLFLLFVSNYIRLKDSRLFINDIIKALYVVNSSTADKSSRIW